VLNFIDTPGFQHARKILKFFVEYTATNSSGPGAVNAFIEKFGDKDEYRDDLQLLQPIADGAAVIFVVDSSHPIRRDDKAEMEILRLTGCPRMALINNKSESVYAAEWKNCLNQNYNIIREFNAHHASFTERIELLEALKAMHQEWAGNISFAIDAIKEDWQSRLTETVSNICDMLEKVVPHKVSIKLDEKKQTQEELKTKLLERYQKSISKTEKRCHDRIRKLFRHDVFSAELESDAVFGENDLFAAETWRLLGLSRMQIVTASAAAGAATGVAIDIALAGITFGVFTAGGAIAGGLTSFLGAGRLGRMRIGSFKLGGEQLQLGPLKKESPLPAILVDRALLYFNTISQWAHARQQHTPKIINIEAQTGLTQEWTKEEKAELLRYIKSIKSSPAKLFNSGFDNKSTRENISRIMLDKIQ
jgi:hypothetical protein